MQYHSVDKNEWSFRDHDGEEPEGDFSVYTWKALGREMVGSTVWLISGEGQPREYRLEQRFTVDGVQEPAAPGEPRSVYGSAGTVFRGGILLNRLQWFRPFRELMANFSLGVQQIPEEYVRRLEETAGRHSSIAVAVESAAGTGTAGPAERRAETRLRIVRDNAVTAQVKRWHDFPALWETRGEDRTDNVLCLCPNDHVLFDGGAFSIGDDFGLVLLS
jgi:hypothetical protein